MPGFRAQTRHAEWSVEQSPFSTFIPAFDSKHTISIKIGFPAKTEHRLWTVESLWRFFSSYTPPTTGMACIWTNQKWFHSSSFQSFLAKCRVRNSYLFQTVWVLFPSSSHPSGSLEVLESRKVLVHCAEIQKRLLNCERKFAFQTHWRSQSTTLRGEAQTSVCLSFLSLRRLENPVALERKTLYALCLSYLVRLNYFWCSEDCRKKNQNMLLFYF